MAIPQYFLFSCQPFKQGVQYPARLSSGLSVTGLDGRRELMCVLNNPPPTPIRTATPPPKSLPFTLCNWYLVSAASHPLMGLAQPRVTTLLINIQGEIKAKHRAQCLLPTAVLYNGSLGNQ